MSARRLFGQQARSARTRPVCLAALATLGLLAGACTGSTGDDHPATSGDNNLTEAQTPRKGSTIMSPSVDPSKMYWGARTIDSLVQVGYLTADEAKVATRADGILTNSPPNNKIGVDELAALESPAHVNTLFPAEKAVIPKLWSILVIDDATAYTPSGAAIPSTVHDTYSVAHFQLPIAKLPNDQQLASRIELTQNSDGDATTISGSDVEKAFADRGSYLPSEIARFHDIALQIASGATPLASDTQFVDVPASSQQVLLDAPPVKLVTDLSLSVVNSWRGVLAVQPQLSAAESITLTNTDPNTRIMVIDKTSGADTLVQQNVSTSIRAATRVEVWKGGTRTLQLDAVPSSGGSAVQAFPFGFGVKIGGATQTLVCFGNDQGCSYTSSKGVDVPVPATSYYVEGHPDYRLDVFEDGRALFVAPGAPAATCYPVVTSSNQVLQCKILDASGQTTGVINFSNGNVAQTPYVATAQFNAPYAPGVIPTGLVGLYPY